MVHFDKDWAILYAFAFMLIFAMNAVSYRSSLRRKRIPVECTVTDLLECVCVEGGHQVTINVNISLSAPQTAGLALRL